MDPAFLLQCLTQKKVVQINLDNALTKNGGIIIDINSEDVKRVGLLPLVNLLQSGNVCLTAIGVNNA
jgi:hypothetical protein